ncbi:MAG: hypothetical protein L6R36_000086 [Xanthoria steineri]|nr:MAG: hypothetical protein L6R36_000086 [Xanthoria steineri]
MSDGRPDPPKTLQSLSKAFAKFDLDGHDLPPSPAPSSPRNGKRYAIATELVYTEGSDQYGASSTPIYQTATFKQTSGSGGGEYDYTRSGNPTRTHLERHLAKIMNAERALVVSSGMGALDVITRLLKPGDEVVTGDDLYGGTNRLLKFLSTHGGIIVHHVDTTNADKVRRVLGSKTAMVLLETPTNPLIKIVDIPTIARATHEANPAAVVAVDNTMLSPLLQNPLDLGADVVYESGTKYLSGHHDLMAGVIAVNKASIGEGLYFVINSTGCGLSPFDSWLLMRGVKTLKVRLEQQQSNAQRIAEFLESHGFKVRYPGLPSHPQYQLHNSMARGAGAVLSFETGDTNVSERIVEAARLWAISVSFGCVNSLISMPCRMSHASIDAKTRQERAMPEDIIRLCVGIEDADDLIDDLSRAYAMSNGAGRNDVPRAEEHHAPSNPKGVFKQPSATVSTVAYLKVWNTKKLHARIASDAVSAASAAALIAPLITIFDRGIIENASGRSPLLSSIKTSFRALLARPHTFLASRPFRLISMVYFSTYLTANSIDTISSTLTPSAITHTTSGTSKFLAASTVNMSLCLYKDSQFAQMFRAPGSAASALTRSVPKASFALFGLRDSMTVFASFNLPPLVAPMVSAEVEKVVSRASLTQILTPAAMQVFTTPLHLWGLDLYNRPGASLAERVRQVGKNWAGSTLARMGRIIPAFGFGGVINAKVRRRLMEKLEDE